MSVFDLNLAEGPTLTLDHAIVDLSTRLHSLGWGGDCPGKNVDKMHCQIVIQEFATVDNQRS